MMVARWGKSLVVRLPSAVVEALGLKEGDDIDIHVAGQGLGIAREAGCAEFLAPPTGRGRLPDDFRFDRHDANAR